MSMLFETVCELVLKEDDHVVLDPEGAKLLEMVYSFGSLTVMAKRMGVPEGEVAGALDSLNRNGNALVEIDAEDASLTDRGREALDVYRTRQKVLDSQLDNLWKRPWLTTDGIIIYEGRVVLIRRGREPFKGMFALPGGIVEHGERVEDCVVREMREETGLETRVASLSGVYSDPDRDPRGHFVTIAFNLEAEGGKLAAGDDAASVRLFDICDLPEMASDHRRILDEALRQRRLL
ncbi:MAG: NUDIX domain-containing protein [Methanomassiliicoccales archaeon]|jgi:8-oxo-dGTP diphosphatase